MKLRSLALALLLTGPAGLGCSSALVRAARDQNDEAFRVTLASTPAQVAARELRDVARARAERAVDAAAGEEGLRVIETVADCAVDLREALERKALGTDVVAARAALGLADHNITSPLAFARHFASSDAAWRAAGARSLVLAERASEGPPCEPGWADCDDGDERRGVRVARFRRAAMLDVHREVRRAGLAAARDAADPGDVAALLDAARRDPDQALRVLAIEAIARGRALDGVIGLTDLWPTASEDERLAIVRAWADLWRPEPGTAASSAARPSEGAPSRIEDVAFEALRRVVESDSGLPSFIAAAEILEGSPAHRTHPALVSAEGGALATLVRGIESASAPVIVDVIEVAPLARPRVREAVAAASKSENPLVAVAALARLLETSALETTELRTAALTTLDKHAQGNGDEAQAALDALVRLGDGRARAQVDKRLKAEAPEQRREAAVALIALGDRRAAAQLLADADVTVRLSVACALIAADAP
ncbi:MAG: hypothetical protein FJ096_05045 [Deltaproteobacteria bacterium]|nr:hypothetical protein [Deltaproteobacteria bacterium]